MLLLQKLVWKKHSRSDSLCIVVLTAACVARCQGQGSSVCVCVHVYCTLWIVCIHCKRKRRTLPVQWTGYRMCKQWLAEKGTMWKFPEISLGLFTKKYRPFADVLWALWYEKVLKITVHWLKKVDHPLDRLFSVSVCKLIVQWTKHFRFLITNICSVLLEFFGECVHLNFEFLAASDFFL